VPLPENVERKPLHHRQIEMRAYQRKDGLLDIEGRVIDTKSEAFWGPLSTEGLPAGQPIHDLAIRLVVDDTLLVIEAIATSDATPFSVCKEASGTLSGLVGHRIGPGWTRVVKEQLRGSKGCTHLMELLGPMATTAIQAIWPLTKVRPTKVDADGKPLKIDSCYAYSSDRMVVQQLWPAYYTGREKKKEIT
jgi:hypothetical protein